MQSRAIITGVALAAAAFSLTLPSQAQTGSVTVTSSGGTYRFQTSYNIVAPTISGGQYTYNYTLTLLPPTGGSIGSNTLNVFTFSFSGNPTFVSATPTSFGPPTNPSVNSSATGYFVFVNFPGLTAATPTASFVFQTTQAPGGTLGITSNSNAGDVSATAGLPGPVAAPEPGSLLSLGVLGSCLGMGIAARKRKSLPC